MTSDIALGELVLPGILAVVVYLVALMALILGRRWAMASGPPRSAPPPAPRQPAKARRLRVIAGGGKPAASRA